MDIYNTMDIWAATAQDIPFWKQVRQEIYAGLTDEFLEAEMARILEDRLLACFVARDAVGTRIGLLELSLRNIVDGCLTSPVGYIEGIYLRSDQRGKGRGRRLVEFAVDWFRAQGCREMAADAELDNLTSQGFFSHLGFEETDRIVEFRKSL